MPQRATQNSPAGVAGVRQLRAAEARPLPLSDGRCLGVRSWKGAGPPLVLLHGLLDCSQGWERLARSTRRRCVAIDLPGFGSSDPARRARICAYAEDVEEALGALGLHEFVLVGHSLGGAVATALAERLGKRVLSLVLLAPAGFGRIHLAEAISIPGVRNVAAIALPFALSNPLVLAAAYTGVVSARRLPDPALVERVTRRAFDSVRGARDGTQAVVAAGLSRGAFHRRRVRYDGPVSVVWGERDRLVPRGHCAGVSAALPQAKLELWPGMGHHPQHERPGQLSEFVERSCRAVAETRPRMRVAA